MGRQAEHVYTDQASIHHLEALVRELPTNGHVRLSLKDGSRCDGFICERPNVQLFRDAEEREGFNGVVRLDHRGIGGWSRFVWLDQIARVEHLDSTLGSET
ncbi:DUF3247 family protein [Fulvimonas soli]|uniref:Uncharacterized protein DUF3247 n=1 Tax=Fulvimonas soli TaxID=155197 RepID=A0A316HYZ2_9GAMM|nr:DUF3247 family protein [Fulvimonas soli]PWK85918.1 uncharacterized protein DUF3247 [Fulvimonas soli]TNY25402.1 hypothetical protein BV497_14090 [Fulvimonas soli]